MGRSSSKVTITNSTLLPRSVVAAGFTLATRGEGVFVPLRQSFHAVPYGYDRFGSPIEGDYGSRTPYTALHHDLVIVRSNSEYLQELEHYVRTSSDIDELYIQLDSSIQYDREQYALYGKETVQGRILDHKIAAKVQALNQILEHYE